MEVSYGSILNSGANLSDPDQKRIFFDQYKLFIDSTSKIVTARKETNIVYITLNFAILSTAGFIAEGKVFPDKNLLLVATLMIIGIGSVMSWLSVLSLYKTIDYESYNITKEFETYLPCNVYTRFNQYLSH